MNNTNFWSEHDYIDIDGYYHHCCGTIVLRVSRNTSLNDCYCYCKKCKKEFKLNPIIKGRIIKEKSTIIPYNSETA